MYVYNEQFKGLNSTFTIQMRTYIIQILLCIKYSHTVLYINDEEVRDYITTHRLKNTTAVSVYLVTLFLKLYILATLQARK